MELVDTLEAARAGAGEERLDRYQRRRRTLNAEFIQEQTINNKKRLEEKDPAARKLTVAVTGPVTLDFGRVPEGRYAISLIHDENGNGKLDTRLMIPREGYGFSRDAPVRMGPPKFAQAAFDVAGEPVRLAIRMRYLL
jgi:uncharacterized protein (DUF2141 family)